MGHILVHDVSDVWTSGAVSLTAIGWAQAVVVRVMVVSLTAGCGLVMANARVGSPSYEDNSYFLSTRLAAVFSQSCGCRCPGNDLGLGVPCTVICCLCCWADDGSVRCALGPYVFHGGVSVVVRLTAVSWTWAIVVKGMVVDMTVGRGPVITYSMVGSTSHKGVILIFHTCLVAFGSQRGVRGCPSNCQ